MPARLNETATFSADTNLFRERFAVAKFSHFFDLHQLPELFGTVSSSVRLREVFTELCRDHSGAFPTDPGFIGIHLRYSLFLIHSSLKQIPLHFLSS
jgi:hypothetical protein